MMVIWEFRTLFTPIMPSCSLIPLEFHVADLTVLLESLPQSSSSPSTTTTTITLPFEIRVLEREWLGDAVPRVGRREETEMIRTLGFRDALYESAVLPSRPRICVETRQS